MADEPDDDELEAYLRSSLSERRRSRWGRQSLRRGSSPFLTEGMAMGRHGRRLSTFTTSSGDDTAISIEEEETPEEVKENMRLNKQIIDTIKFQPWRIKKKYKILRKAKAYVHKHEGELAQSRRSKDVFAKYTLLWSKLWARFKREVANFIVVLTPWEMRIKRIESHFGSVVASYFTFLRWVFWINCFISAFVCCFLMVPEVLRGAEDPTGMRKEVESDEKESALNLKNIIEFEGYLKYSPIFYGYYSDQEKTAEGYRLPLAYFLTSICVYVFSFFAILRRMAENSRMSKLSEKDDECTFAWKLFTGWDYMIGNAETAYNKVASLVMGFKEAILEEKEKKKEVTSWQLIVIRVAANFAVLILLVSSAYAVSLVVTRSQEIETLIDPSWYRQNEVTIVVSLISNIFPTIFDMIGIAERYHPRVQLRWQLARILVLNLLTLYTLIFSLFDKVFKTTRELGELAKNITETVGMMDELKAQNDSMAASRRLMGFSGPDEDLSAESPTTLFSLPPINCTLIVIHNCTLAALYAGLNLTDPLLTTATATTPFGNATLDGDYFLDNSTLDEDSAYSSLVGNIANLTMHGMANWSGGPPPPPEAHLPLPSVFLNGSSTLELTDGKMTWDIPLEFTHDMSDNWTLEPLNDTLSTLPSDMSTTLLHNESTSDEGSTTDDDFSTTDSSWPPELNCTLEIPVCSTIATTTEDAEFASTTEGYESTTDGGLGDGDFTANGTDAAENATAGPICPRVPTCPKCPDKDEKKIPKAQELVRVDEKTKDALRKRCWETAFGQELVKLTVMDLAVTTVSTVVMDFLRAVFVRYANRCWCWDLEKGFPGYGDFKIAENILHLVNNQGMVWMGMFFSPGLPAINTVKLCILVYVRSWAVLTANIPHETVFRASRSNNFYYALLLIMLFLCTLPVGFACVWLEPSWHCGPFSRHERIYKVLTSFILRALPNFMVEVVQYLTSPGTVIPVLLLLVLIIYYLVSLTGSLREANNDLKMQLRREKGEREKPAKQDKPPDEPTEISDNLSKWPSTKKLIPSNKFPTPAQILGEDSEDSQDTPMKKKGKHLPKVGGSDPSDDQFEGPEDKKAHREEHKDRLSRKPSPLSVDRSSSEGEERRWIRRGGITGNGDLPLITISQASEGRDSPGQLSSLNSSEDVSPPSSAHSLRRRPALIPSVSEQEEDEYVDDEEEEEDEPLAIEIRDDTHFEPIRDAEANGEQEEVSLAPEVITVTDRAETKELTGCAPSRRNHVEGYIDSNYTDHPRRRQPSTEKKATGRTSRHSLRRSKAVKGSDSLGSSDSSNLPPPTAERAVKLAKIQRLDTDSL